MRSSGFGQASSVPTRLTLWFVAVKSVGESPLYSLLYTRAEAVSPRRKRFGKMQGTLRCEDLGLGCITLYTRIESSTPQGNSSYSFGLLSFSSFTTSSWPFEEAIDKAVFPVFSLTFTSAPFSRSSLTISN